MTTVAPADLQQLCEQGQRELMRMDYLLAQATLLRADQLALTLSDFETLSRLYMPLQETRRQVRQRCGEGTIQLRLLADGPEDSRIDPEQLIRQYNCGQLLIAGWGTLEPARQFRALATEQDLYVETFLAAVYPASAPASARLIAVLPLAECVLPSPIVRTQQELQTLLPAGSIVLQEDELPPSQTKGNIQSYAWTMNLWEKLHAPYLAAADAEPDLLRRMDGYRKAIAVDYACELAHQKLSAAAAAHAQALARAS
jgi:hypothetical protein